MKHSLIHVVRGLLVATVVALTACGGGGGGSSSPTGGIAGALGTSGYFPPGSWTGALVVQNPGQAVIFLNSFGLCQGVPGGCTTNGPGYFQLQIYNPTSNNNMLPGQVTFSLTPYVNGYQSGSLSNQTASAFLNGSNNGMLINYNGQYGNGYGYGAQYQQNPNVPVLQINTQYTDTQMGAHPTMNVQIIFNGTQIASGTVNLSGNGYYGNTGYNTGYQQPYTNTSYGYQYQYQQPTYYYYPMTAAH